LQKTMFNLVSKLKEIIPGEINIYLMLLIWINT